MKILKNIIKKIIFLVCFLKKIEKNKIVFINFNGKGYGCNPKYILEEINKQGLEYKMTWILIDLNEKLPKNVHKVKKGSINEVLELSSAKIIITNVKNSMNFIKKKNQIIIQTWHGSYSPKFLEKAAQNKLPLSYIKESEKNSKMTNYFISNSELQTKEYIENFWCKCEILETGYPRNDIFFNYTKEYIQEIKKKLNLNSCGKIILYTPTFRDGAQTEGYNLNCNRLIKELGFDNITILIRMHPNIIQYKSLFNFGKQVVDVTNYPDIQELLLISDILITDYSTTMFDFSLLKRPVFLYASDIENYKNMRGIKEIYFNLPFTIAHDNDELINNMKHYDKNIYLEKLEKFDKEYKNYDDGNASKRIVNKIKEIIN